ncbi:hypothetical protein BKA64DRAFT_648555 [Cadophora sp. MPI-SDFR-AT-0126]|nr:hypothetical protein BKA64DRAFT_648555 [Leotiomycetes sp. MPI-SDFR-AT-0126]
MSTNRIPQDVWHEISRHLPLWSALKSSNVLGFSLDATRKKHAALCRLIFRNSEWLQDITERLGLSPVLIGAALKVLFNTPNITDKAYLVLCVPTSRGLRADDPAFLRSLQPHKICADGSIAFTNSNLILYAPLSANPIYTIPNIQRLFQDSGKELQSAYLAFDTTSTYKFREFGSRYITGKKGKNPTLEDIDEMCYLRTGPSSSLYIFSTLHMTRDVGALERILSAMAEITENSATG